MQLNPDCVRSILLTVENLTNGRIQYFFNNEMQVQSLIDEYCELQPYCYEEVDYHFMQCIKSGYIQGDIGSQYGFWFSDLTPEGHEFINTIRSSNIWKETLKKIKPLGTVSITVISQVASALAKAALGL